MPRASVAAAVFGGLILFASLPSHAQSALPCAAFTQDTIAAPEPRQARWPVGRFEQIKAAVKSERHRVLFLGNSITERFPTDAPRVWREHMVPRGVLNAGISGDRTEHLLWRLQRGNLDGPAPKGAILLIGTNDVGADRPPEIVAQGIRADLSYLRQHLPHTPILLLGLLPRGASADSRYRPEIAAVNRLIQRCGDGKTIVYADIGRVLLDPEGRLTPEISPDRLHFSALGYGRLVPQLDALIDRLLAGR